MVGTKRIALGGLLCLAIFGIATSAGAGPRFGAVAGPLASRFGGGTDDFGLLTREARRTWGGGGGLRIENRLSPGVAFATGVEYVEAPDVARLATPASGRVTWRIRRHEVAVPLVVELHRGAWRAGLGPQVRYLLSARRTSEDYEAPVLPGPQAAPARPGAAPAAQIFEEVGTFDGSGDATGFYQRWTLALQAGIGRAWAADRHELRADVRAGVDLTEASDRFGDGLRGTSVGFTLGLLW